MEEKMKKMNLVPDFVGIEINTAIDFRANVNLGKRGGGGLSV
jgi:hypothetical protein